MKNFNQKSLLFLSMISIALGSFNQQVFADTNVSTTQWETIDTANLATQPLSSIPKNFLWGAGTAAYQIEGGIKNSWTHYPDKDGKIHDAGTCCNSWNMLDQDIECLKELGAKCYRFSIEWARLQPENAQDWDQSALEKYVDFCMKLKAANIEPVITLHHYTDPIWFLQQGGFSDATNIKYFVAYVEKVFTALAHANIQYIITFNQPSAYALKSYARHDSPPFETSSPISFITKTKTAITVENLFEAHVQSYKAIARIAQAHNVTKPYISISHQYVQMKTAEGALFPVSLLISFIANKAIYNGSFENFFLHGAGKEYMDFVALSYYCPLRFELSNAFAYTKEELANKADSDFRIIDGDGFYNALVWSAQFKKPIFVIENGIETDNDAKRVLFLNRYLSKMNDAIKDGYNVIGYCHWALLDNFQWTQGFDYHFGLFSVNRENGSFARTIKTSGVYYQDIIACNS